MFCLILTNEVSKFKLNSCLMNNNINFTNLSSPATKQFNFKLVYFYRKPGMIICSLKPLSLKQFEKNFHLGAQNSVCYDDMQSQFHAPM